MWNAVAALAVPETARKKLDALVTQLKLQIAGPTAKEVKLKDVARIATFSSL